MAVFDRVATYVALSGLFSLAVLALIPILLRRKTFDFAAMIPAGGFMLMTCIAGLLISSYAIDSRNYVDLMAVGKHAEGTIVDFEHHVDRSRGGRSRDCPVVQFVGVDAISRKFAVHDSHCSDAVDIHSLPLHVTVTYLEARPEVAKVLEWQGPPLVVARSIGFACVAFAALCLWLYSAIR